MAQTCLLLLWGWGFDRTDPGSLYSDLRWPHVDGCWNKKESWRKGKKQDRAAYQRKMSKEIVTFKKV